MSCASVTSRKSGVRRSYICACVSAGSMPGLAPQDTPGSHWPCGITFRVVAAVAVGAMTPSTTRASESALRKMTPPQDMPAGGGPAMARHATTAPGPPSTPCQAGSALGDAPAAAYGEVQRPRTPVARDEAHPRRALGARPAQVDERRPPRAVQDPRAAHGHARAAQHAARAHEVSAARGLHPQADALLADAVAQVSAQLHGGVAEARAGDVGLARVDDVDPDRPGAGVAAVDGDPMTRGVRGQ